jgi:adenylate cyclase
MSEPQSTIDPDADGGPAPPHTFLFADLAGFTALTEAHGDEEAADLIASFCAEVRQMLPDHGAQEVKTIGDELMIRTDNAADAVRLALRVVGEVGGRHGFPAVRAGLHTGPAVERGDDWFGATVNVASRVSRHATAGEVLLTEASRQDALDELGDIELAPREPAQFKNVGQPVELWAVLPEGQGDERSPVEIDPVCRMAVIPERAFAAASHRDHTHHFCSQACADAFREDPERYL